MNAKVHKIVIHMSRLAIYALIIVQSLLMAMASEIEAQRRLLSEIEITIPTFDKSEVSLGYFINEIQKISDFKFIYPQKLVRGKDVSIRPGAWKMDELLREISYQGQLSLRRVNETIALTPAENISSLPVLLEEISIQQRINGVVTDGSGEGLPGVSIVIKGTTQGTVSDLDGNFNLEVPSEESILVFSSVGFVSQEAVVGNRSTINIEMIGDVQALGEVVVIGYGGEVNKRDLTGAVATTNLKRATEFPHVSVVQALQGSIPGLNVGAVTSAGQNPSLTVRGQSTLSSSGADNEPLIVVDGIIYRGSLIDLNTADIKSIDVLKDASSAAIYGSQASNGVIVITTKTGTISAKPVVNYSASYSIQQPSKSFEPMNAAELEEFYPDIWWNLGGRIAPDYLQVDPNYVWQNNFKTLEINQGYNDGVDTPWWDLLTDNGHVNTHNISVQGRGNSVGYFISGGFTDQAAFIKNDTYQRYNFRANLDVDVNDFITIGTQTFVTVSDYSGQDAGSSVPFLLQPWAPIRDSQGELIPRPEGGWLNPFLTLEIDNEDVRFNLSSVLFTQIELPIEGLSYRLNFANNYRTRDYSNFDPNAANFQGAGSKSNFRNRDWMLDNIVTYKRDFGDHHLNATLVYGVEQRDINEFTASAQNFGVDILSYNRLQAGDPTLNGVSSNKEQESSLYQMVRLLYDFQNKYYFTGTVRRDGFSGFGQQNKTGVFPSVAVGWVLSEEAFLSGLDPVDFLKLRASYGSLGRRGVGRYATLAQVSTGPSYVFGDGGQTFQGQQISSLSNPALGWETTTGTNIGLDFALFGSRIQGNLEYYNNTTENILFAIQLPRISGFDAINSNIAEVSNNGFEMALSATIIDNGAFKWESSVNFNRVRNKIESIIGADNDEDGVEDDLVASRLFIGEPQNVIYDYEIVGMWQLADDADGSIWPGFFPGTYKLNDLNNDGDISSLDDRKVLGYVDPAYRFGVGNTLTYGNFSLYIFINSIQGGKNYYMGTDAPHAYGSFQKSDQLGYSNIPKGAWDYWMPENPNARFRRLDTPSNFEATPYSQRSFVRLQDVSLSYDLPASLVEKISLSNLKLFLSGKNLITWTDWIGQDPETGVGFRPDAPLLRSYSLGLNVQF